MIVIRNLKEDDIEKVVKFVKNCKPLTEHTYYTYWVLSKYFSDLCFLCEDKYQEILGLITGILPVNKKNKAFIWQIGVRKDYRRKGIALSLIDRFVNKCNSLNIYTIDFTIEPDNLASYNLFNKYAKDKGILMEKVDVIKTKYWEEILYTYKLK